MCNEALIPSVYPKSLSLQLCWVYSPTPRLNPISPSLLSCPIHKKALSSSSPRSSIS